MATKDPVRRTARLVDHASSPSRFANSRRCFVVTPRTRVRAGRQFLRLAMPVPVLRTFPATARCALASPASLLSALFLLRKTVPFSRPRRQSQFCPLRGTRGSRPSAGACPPTYGILRHCVPQNDKTPVILSGATCPLVGIVVARRPKGLPSTPFLLRKTVPSSRLRRQSQFYPSGARQDPARRTPRFMHILSRLTGAAGCHSPYCTDFPFLI